MKCNECGKKLGILPYRCKFCGQNFCTKHRLPESHECSGLKEWKAKARKKPEITYGPFRPEKEGIKERKLKLPFKELFERISAPRRRFKNYTFWIIAACIIIFLLQLSFGGYPTCAKIVGRRCVKPNPFTELLWMDPGIFFSRPWTLLSSIFLHGGIFHLFVNMLVLWFFGGALERRIGSNLFLLVFFTAGICANLGYLVVSQFVGLIPALGASGAVFGIFASLAIIAPHIRVLLFFFLPMRITTALILFAIYDLINLFQRIGGFAGAGVASSAHLTGLAVGLAFGFWLKERVRRERPFFYI